MRGPAYEKGARVSPLGVHVSIAGGVHLAVERAARLGCDAMQLFGRNPRTWKRTGLDPEAASVFRKKREEEGIRTVAVHTAYLINLSSHDEHLFERSLELFKRELAIAWALGAEYLVTHLGSPGKEGGPALERITSALEEIRRDHPGPGVRILFENTAGGGSSFGWDFTELALVLDAAENLDIEAGLCLDTCHAFAAGYPLAGPEDADSLVEAIDRECGAESVELVHLNDSKGGCGSRLDRHEDIGAGKIGLTGLAALLNHPALDEVPVVLETPKTSEEDDRRNLEVTRGIRRSI